MELKGSKYSLKAYQVLLITNKSKRILVEGKDDKQFFSLLIHELSGSNNNLNDKISIDSASDFITCQDLLDASEDRAGLGNREKVERICRKIPNKYSEKLVGFVDREFREFDCSESGKIIDNIEKHNIEDRIIWSRGHSIENYFFDRSVLAETLRFHLSEDWFDKSIKLFELYFESIISIGCAVSVAAFKQGKIGRIEKSINWRLLKLENEILDLDAEQWKNDLISKQILTSDEAETIIKEYSAWKERLNSVDFHLTRWLCHGHIGFKCVLSLFSFCIAKTCPISGSGNPEKYLGNFKDDKHFNFCANVWLKKVVSNQCEHPLDALRELGLKFA